MRRRRALVTLGVLAAALLMSGALTSFARADAGSAPGLDDFVHGAGAGLTLGGREFKFAGTNTYYLAYKSQFMVDDARLKLKSVYPKLEV